MCCSLQQYCYIYIQAYIHTYTTGERQRKNGNDRNEDFQDMVRERNKTHYVELSVYVYCLHADKKEPV
jgi:hypothetical protein